MIGKYERASLEEREGKNSIAGQKELIDGFLDSRGEFRGCEARDFADDGYTGMDPDRPAFRELLEEVRSGRIDTIVVKDFSRFGSAENEETEKLLEQIFPVLGIRFISIRDSFDSRRHGGVSGEFDRAVSELCRNGGRRAVGKRLLIANAEKWEQGYSTAGSAPFGYLPDPERKGRYRIDPLAAGTVKEIFDLASAGRTAVQIACQLNEEKVLIPSEYNRLHRIPGKEKQYSLNPDQIWDAGKVRRLLSNFEYTGAAVRGKSSVPQPGSGVSRSNGQKSLFVTPAAHEPIVSREQFELAQAVIASRTKWEYAAPNEFALRGKIRCGHCHKVMLCDFQLARPMLWCRDGREMAGYSKCPSDQYPLDQIETKVFYSLKCLMKWLEESEKSAEREERAEREARAQLSGRLKKFRDEKELTPEMVSCFIDCVYVRENGELEICLREQILRFC